MNRRFWTAEEEATLRRLYPDMLTADLAKRLQRPLPAVYQKAQLLRVKKSAAFLASPVAGRMRQGSTLGASGRFRPGQVPANKGLRRPGWAPGRMRETQFKRGVRQGVAVRLYKPIGTERVSKDGYLERKVNDDLPLQARWRAVHLIVWEAAHGPVPKSHAIAFRNGDRTDISLENLVCIPRRELMARNSVHNYPPPVAQAVQLLGALTRQIRRRARGKEPDHRPA